jgi:hypothetical protein
VKKLILTLFSFWAFTVSAIAMSQRECSMMWREADLNKDGVLNVYEQISYLAMVRMANKTMVADGTFADKLFQESCKTNRLTATMIARDAELSTNGGQLGIEVSQASNSP